MVLGSALALLALAAGSTSARARTYTVRWTHGAPSLVTGFRLYVRAGAQSYGNPSYDGLPTAVDGVYSASVSVPDGQGFYLRADAYGPGGESGPSNELFVSASPATPVCGNGIRESGESCDDGNHASGDGCRSDCTAEICGDAIVDAPREQCDDGNAVSGDGCDVGCVVSGCGNGIVAGGEACDDGNAISGDGCDANCAVTGCGNGVLGPGELCDDGNAVSGDGCDANCTPTACGNGVATAGEACDDGNLQDGDRCSAGCQVEGARQSAAQVRCILEINQGVARIARVQTRDQQRCLGKRMQTSLAEAPTSFDACLEADLRGRVESAEQKLADVDATACVRDEIPTLALGDDRLAGLSAASGLPAALVRDLFGSPARARPASEERAAARCQREALRGVGALFRELWRLILDAETRKLEGRHMPAATSDEDLAGFLETAVAESPAVDRGSRKLVQLVVSRCDGLDVGALFPGCAPADPTSLGACAVHATRCRACQLLVETDRRLAIDCDAFDDGAGNGSCPAVP